MTGIMNKIHSLDWKNPNTLAQISDIYSSRTSGDFLRDALEDAPVFYITDSDGIASFIHLQADEYGLILAGFTRIDAQNRGYFSDLYQYFLAHRVQILSYFDFSDLDVDLEIKTSDDPAKISHLAKKFGWKHDRTDLLFVKDLSRFDPKAFMPDLPRNRYAYLRENEGYTRKYTVFHKKRKIAHFSLSDVDAFGDENVFFHSFEVRKKYRRQGHASGILKDVLSRLRADYRKLYLHVFADNIPAVELYRKLEFAVAEKFDYYEVRIRNSLYP